MSDRIAVMRGGTIAALLPGRSAAHTVISAALGQGKTATVTSAPRSL